MLKYALLLTFLIHLALITIRPNVELSPTKNSPNHDKKQRIRISLFTIKKKRISDSSPASTRRRPIVQPSVSELKFSKEYFQKNIENYNPSRIEVLDPGGTKRSCLKELLASAVKFPDIIFQNQISGKAVVDVIIKKGTMLISQRDEAHPLLSKLLCNYLKQQVEKIKGTDCLKQSEIRGKYTLSVTYSYGHRNINKSHILSREYSFFIQRIKKASALRALMAISNIFTLLEIYQSSEDKGLERTFLLNLQKLNCSHLEINT